MKIKGSTPNQGPEASRLTSAKPPAPKEGERSFGAILKKATEAHAAPTTPPQVQTAPLPAPEEKIPSRPVEPGSFADHIEMIKLRLKSGYYNSQNVDDALSEKLTGYFDDLA